MKYCNLLAITICCTVINSTPFVGNYGSKLLENLPKIISNLNLIYILKVLAFEQEMKHYTNAKKKLNNFPSC